MTEETYGFTSQRKKEFLIVFAVGNRKFEVWRDRKGSDTGRYGPLGVRD